MRRIFADAQYWVALLNDKDQGHVTTRAVSRASHGATVVAAEEVLTEVLAFFSARGDLLRWAAVTFIEGILSNPGVVVRPQSHQSFLDGLALYKARPDKQYRAR